MENTFCAYALVAGCFALGTAYAADDKDALVKDALSAASPEIAKTAMVMDWDHSMLKQGTGAYTCMPTPPDIRAKGGREPMCLDKVWEAWGDAWMNKKPFKATGVGIAFMLAGDTGASNTDPYAQAATSNNQWVVEGPHLMVILPDTAQLASLSTDPHNGWPYVCPHHGACGPSVPSNSTGVWSPTLARARVGSQSNLHLTDVLRAPC